MAAAKESKKAKAGEAVQAAPPVNQERILGLIHKMFPESREKSKTLQDGVTWLLAENDRLKRHAAELEENQAGPNIKGETANGDVLAGIGRIEASLKQFKEQLSTMRQYGVGLGK